MKPTTEERAIGTRKELPTGTVTFLFTDIEGSTRLLQDLGADYPSVLEAHNDLMRRAIGEAGGVEVRTEGDSFFAVFSSAVDAVAAVVSAQRSLAHHEFPADVRVRMGLHTGIAALGGDDYLGIDVHRAARIASAGSGGQVLLSAASVGLVENSLPVGVRLRDMGLHTLKDLSHPEHLYQLVIDGLIDEFPPLRTLTAVRHNLPTHLSSLVGRDLELREAVKLLETSRLLTLTGPGGTGKTRLSLHVAAAVADQYADGVYFVGLDSVSDEAMVPSRILDTFPGHLAEPGASPAEHLVDYVAGRSMLLVLDNFEHVVGAAPIVPRMLQASPGSKIIATSRIPLRVGGEQEMHVPPLAAPDLDHLPPTEALAGVDAVALFVDRAVAVRPSFALDHTNGPAVAELTARLDGLPLAIELAAARVRMLSPQAILDNLGPKVLSGGPRDAPARQRDLRNTIAWSYDLLPEPCRLLLERLSVFAGTARFEEIDAVCGDALGAETFDALETLVDHSLVRQRVDRTEPRYRMLETIRHFAQERLAERGEEAELRARHAAVFAALAAAAEPHLTGPDRVEWLDRLSDDHDNLRLAQKWCVEQGEADVAFGMAAALWRFFHMRGHLYAARELLDELLAMPGGSPSSRAKALEAAGGVAYWSGDMPAARRRYEDALGILRELGDDRGVAYGLYNLAFARGYGGDMAGAIGCLNEALAMFEALDDQAGVAAVTWGLGDASVTVGDLDGARTHFERSIADFEQLGDDFGLGWALFTYGDVLVRLGRLDAAREALERGMRLFASDDLSAVVLFLAGFASLAIAAGEEARGARLAGAMAGLRDLTGTDLVTVGLPPVLGVDAEAFSSMEGELGRTYEQGRLMSAADAVAYALGEDGSR